MNHAQGRSDEDVGDLSPCQGKKVKSRFKSLFVQFLHHVLECVIPMPDPPIDVIELGPGDAKVLLGDCHHTGKRHSFGEVFDEHLDDPVLLPFDGVAVSFVDVVEPEEVGVLLLFEFELGPALAAMGIDVFVLVHGQLEVLELDGKSGVVDLEELT